MKRLFPLFIVIIIVLGSIVIRYNYNISRNRDVTYTAKQYITTGVFNKRKLYQINDTKLSFSDGNMAVVTISGLKDKSPHDFVKYEIILEKRSNGAWKVTKVYP